MNYLDFIKPLYKIEAFQGCTEEEITAMKSRFGAIPKAVEDFYRTAAKTPCFQWGQDDWILPEHYQKWTWLERTGALILLNENQGVCQAGVLKKDLSLPDPPVYEFVNDEAQEQISPSVSQFLEAALLYESVWQLDYAPEEFYWLTDEELATVQAKLTKRSAVLRNWMEMEITFYSNRPDNLVVVMDLDGGEYQAIYGAFTQESYAALLEVMEGLGEPI